MKRGLGVSLGAILLLCAASACGQKKLEIGEFAGYVAKFENISSTVGAPVKVDDLVISFGPLPDPRQEGLCELGDGTPTITLRESSWRTMSEDLREALIYHELGHCVLKRVHDDRITRDNKPISLMNHVVVAPKDYVPNKPYYQSELFQKRNEI